MSYLDQRGHRVPSPTDPAQRQDLLALSLSIPSYKACASETAAAQYVSALAAAGLVASAAQPVYVWRTDLNAVRVWDGRRWSGESNLQMELSAVGDVPVGSGRKSLHAARELQYPVPARVRVRQYHAAVWIGAGRLEFQERQAVLRGRARQERLQADAPRRDLTGTPFLRVDGARLLTADN